MIDGFRIKYIEVIYDDGSKERCDLGNIIKESEHKEKYNYLSNSAKLSILFDQYTLGLVGEFRKPTNNRFFMNIGIEIQGAEKLLVLSNNPSYHSAYDNGFYYTDVAADRKPKGPIPPDKPEYPVEAKPMEPDEYIKGFPCWAYPLTLFSVDDIPRYTLFALVRAKKKYYALLALTSGDVTGFIGPSSKLELFIGQKTNNIDLSWFLSIGIDEDPYIAVEKAVNYATTKIPLKHRSTKKEPLFLNKLGWCSWNALLTEDLSRDNILRIVRGLIEKGIPVRWVIIDDGWQDEAKRADIWYERVLRRLSADKKKFPNGLREIVMRLKKLGVEMVGLWHTINVHWSGFERAVVDALKVDSYYSTRMKSHIPPAEMSKAVQFYTKFFRWIKENGFDFVKVDNQWIIHALYWDKHTVGEAARNIQLALQVSAAINGLDILNCMSMTPENYSNYFLSNVLRISGDYIPLWKGDARLHTLFSVYNSLLFSHIAYPDYDMWMTYDPYAKVHAVARIFSGGPIYITDRHPERTDVRLIKRIVLPNGEVIRVDEPGLPTRDILFKDPYNEEALLKIASRSRHTYVMALFNINRNGKEIEEHISLDILPYNVPEGKYAYYKVFSNEKGIINRNDEIPIRLQELDTEILVISPIINGTAIIGLTEYLLPAYPLTVMTLDNGRLLIITRVSGTLLTYKEGKFISRKVMEGEMTILE